MTRRAWSDTEMELLADWYPDLPMPDLMALLGRSEKSIYSQAHLQGLKRSQQYMDSDYSGRVQRGKLDPRMVATQLKPGNVPWNAGRKGWQAGGRSVETRFTTGMLPPNTLPLGSLRVITSTDGIQQLERKVSDDPGPAHKRWRSVHRLVWEAAHGPVPAGHIVVFRLGMKTLVEADITLDRVECITRAENARRNHPASRNPEVFKLVQLKGAITRQVNRIAKERKNVSQSH